MMVFRLSKAQFARDLSGRGAQIAGGRWNSKGIPMVYTSQSRALCTVEIAVHTPLGNIPEDYVLVSVFIPDHLIIKELQEKELPARWYAFPHPHSTQKIGDRFINGKKTSCAEGSLGSCSGRVQFPAESSASRIREYFNSFC